MAKQHHKLEPVTPQARNLIVGYRPNGNGGLFNPAPRLILNGKWLEAAGFSTGQKVQVLVEQGRLVIELAG